MILILKVPAQIVKIETTADKGMKLAVITQELNAADKATLMNYDKKFGWFLFSETDIETSDIPDEKIEFDGQKTSSERLRNVLFRLHESQNGKPEDFEAFRNKVMEKLINHYKAKLDDYQ